MRRRGLLTIALTAVWLSACAPNMAPVYTRGERPATAAESTYVVRRGDTLYSISWRQGLDFRSVARWNHIEPPYTIRPGQRLRLKAPTAPAAAKPRQSSPPPSRSVASSIADSDISWRWPTEGRLARPFKADAQGKQGIELAGDLRQPIHAAAAGRVVYAGSGLRGYGNLVIIKHNARFLTAYGYNHEILVAEGDSVSAGQRIATMGTGPQRKPALHFELRREGKAVDPAPYLPDK